MRWQSLGRAVAVVGLVLGCGSMTHAQWGFGGGWGMGFGGCGVANGAYTLNPPPYFSLFPPVYYSHVTPRPYGASPYAYPGFMVTPERIQMPSTDYVPPARREAQRKAAEAQTAAKPVIIKNPFVVPEADRPERLADGRRVPQVVKLDASADASGDR